MAPRPVGGGRDATCMVDLTRGADGLLRARLLDLVPGRSGTVYRTWLEEQTDAFRAGVRRAALDPFRGYANALRDALPDATPVLDPFHVVKLGSQMLDEVRRRVQQDTLGHRGHKSDPLYRIRNLLRHGAEHLTGRQVARLDAALAAGDPDWQVTIELVSVPAGVLAAVFTVFMMPSSPDEHAPPARAGPRTVSHHVALGRTPKGAASPCTTTRPAGLTPSPTPTVRAPGRGPTPTPAPT